MKNTLKFILLMAGAIVLAIPALRAADATAAPAGKPDRPERRGPGGPGGERRDPGAMLERVTKELGLTADQQAKWKEIDQQQRTAMEAVRNDSTIAREDKRAKQMESMKSFGDQRRAILNADQQKKFDEMQAKMRERGPRGQGGPEGRRGQGNGEWKTPPPPDAPPPGK